MTIHSNVGIGTWKTIPQKQTERFCRTRMITSFFIFNQRGDLIVSKVVTDSIRKVNSLVEVFRLQVIISVGAANFAYDVENQFLGDSKTSADNSIDTCSPILTMGSTTFHYINKNNMWLVAVTRNNVDSGLVWEYIYRVYNIMTTMYGITNDELLKEQFYTVGEILDCTMNVNGVPYDSDLNSIASKIHSKVPITSGNTFMSTKQSRTKTGTMEKTTANTDSRNNNNNNNNNNNSIINPHIDVNNVPWRKNKDIKYKKNKVVLKVVERVNLLVSKNGEILRNNVDGKIDVESKLSGMPIVAFELDSSFLNENNLKLHECALSSGNLINFIPPDGNFELLTYHFTDNNNIPFSVIPNITSHTVSKPYSGKEREREGPSSSTEYNYDIKVKSFFSNKLIANNVQMRIPLPDFVIDYTMQMSGGDCKQRTQSNHKNYVEWTLNKFKGLTEHSIHLTCKTPLESKQSNTKAAPLSSTQTPTKQAPISLKFDITMFSCSGLIIKNSTIKNLSCEIPGAKQYSDIPYKANRWIKYDTTAGNYDFRV